MRDFDGHIVFILWLHIFLLACGVIILSSSGLAYVFCFSVVKSINIGSHYLYSAVCFSLIKLPHKSILYGVSALLNISHDVAILFSMGQDNVSCDQLFTSRECVYQ